MSIIIGIPKYQIALFWLFSFSHFDYGSFENSNFVLDLVKTSVIYTEHLCDRLQSIYDKLIFFFYFFSFFITGGIKLPIQITSDARSVYAGGYNINNSL